MIKQGKDKFYDEFLNKPTKDNFRVFLKNNCGELDEIDFKEQWVEKGHLAKTMLAMANARGGIIVVGIRENEDGSLVPEGINEFKDKAVINNEISKLIPPELDYEIFDYSYEASEYEALQGKKFQLLIVHDTPDRLPFISRGETTDFEKDTIYVRRGTKCEKASAADIDKLLNAKIENIFRESSNLSLDQHLSQLRTLYNELPVKVKRLVRKGEPTAFATALSAVASLIPELRRDQYEEIDNPDYPEETYEAFVNRMINMKKLKIEKYLDLK